MTFVWPKACMLQAQGLSAKLPQALSAERPSRQFTMPTKLFGVTVVHAPSVKLVP